jgi:GntR family transcriptional regulator/MocR family aminotransferase
VAPAAQTGVRLATLAASTRPPLSLNGLLFGYGLIEAAQIDAAMRTLAAAVRGL